MTRIIAHVSALRPMKDSVNWQAIPVGTPLVAGYVPPSHFAWPQAAWARFAGSVEVRITPSASVHGLGIQVLDIETGDATPAQAPGWVNASRAAGQEGTCYCSLSTWPAVIRSINAAGIKAHPPYWVAGYPGGGAVLPSIVVGGVTYTAVAHQYADPATSGGDWDSSVVADYWPGVDTGVPEMELTDKVPVPKLDANGNYAGDGNPAPVSDLLRFSDASVRWLVEKWVPAVNTQLTAIQGALSAEEADLLAAIKAVGTVTATVDPTALAQALETAGLPAALVAALLAVLNKAAA